MPVTDPLPQRLEQLEGPRQLGHRRRLAARDAPVRRHASSSAGRRTAMGATAEAGRARAGARARRPAGRRRRWCDPRRQILGGRCRLSSAAWLPPVSACLPAHWSSPSCATDGGRAGGRPGSARRPDRIDGWRDGNTERASVSRKAALQKHRRTGSRPGSSCLAVVRHGQLARDWNWGTPRTTPREVLLDHQVGDQRARRHRRQGGCARPSTTRSRPTSPSGAAVPPTPSRSATCCPTTAGASGRPSPTTSLLIQAPDRTGYAVGLTQQYPVGSAWAYNNAAIQVLDAVLREATGKPTDLFARERLFGPLRMTHTRMTRDASGQSHPGLLRPADDVP